MARVIPIDHNLETELPAAIKAKITEFEHAVDAFVWAGSQSPEEQRGILESAQSARYNLERTILTYLAKAAEPKPKGDD